MNCEGWRLTLGLCSNTVDVTIVTPKPTPEHEFFRSSLTSLPQTVADTITPDPILILLVVIVCFLAAIGVGVLYGLFLYRKDGV